MQPLVSTEWLAARLDLPFVRVFDTSVVYDDVTGDLLAGRSQYEQAHIPGAGFIDLTGDFSDRTADTILMRPDAAALAEAFGAVGIGDTAEVVLYSSDHLMWATRVWWMLHGLGFSNKAVLDGGLAAWVEEGRSVESGSVEYPPSLLAGAEQPHLWIDMSGVRAALDAPSTSVVCALRPEVYVGVGSEHYGRPGHISGSLNVPHTTVVDPETNKFFSKDMIKATFEKEGVLTSDRIVTYCGGGIAATVDAFALHTLGYDNVSVYDGSLLEWAEDPTTPMRIGASP